MAQRKPMKYAKWDQKDMDNALLDVANGIPISTAARNHGVPRRTLGDRVNGRVAPDAKMGAHTKSRKWNQGDVHNALTDVAHGVPVVTAAKNNGVPIRTLRDRVRNGSAPKAKKRASTKSCLSDKAKREYRKWEQEDMDNALSDVALGIPIGMAAKTNGVPRRTLGDRVHGRTAPDAKMGAHTKLDPQLERQLVQYIDYMTSKGFPLRITQVMKQAWSLDRTAGENKFGENGPSWFWWRRFKSAYPDTTQKLCRTDRVEQSGVTSPLVDSIREYFQLLKSILDEHNFHEHTERVYSCDESLVDLKHTTQHVIVPVRQCQAQFHEVSSTQHVSMHCCVSAAGAAMPPCIIYKQSLPGVDGSKRGPDGCLYAKSDSGFMDSELMVYWFKQLFLKYCPQDRSEDNQVLLLLDGHVSHCSTELVEAALNAHVILLPLGPHTRHICRPLDVAVHKSLKSRLGKLVKTGEALRGGVWVTKKDVASVIKYPFEKAMSMYKIKSGFRECGIIPFDPNAIDKQQLVRAKLIPDTNLDLALPPSYTHTHADACVQTDEVPLPPLKRLRKLNDDDGAEDGAV